MPPADGQKRLGLKAPAAPGTGPVLPQMGGPFNKGGGALSTAIWRMSVGTNGHARWVPEGTDKKSPTFFAQRTNSTDIEPPRSAKKTAFVRRIACQSRKSGFFSPVRPRNEVFATPRAPYMLLADKHRIPPIDTEYRARLGVCPSRARWPALWAMASEANS